MEVVVECLCCLADISYMGRDICSWDDALRYLECYERSAFLCQAYAYSVAADNRYCI